MCIARWCRSSPNCEPDGAFSLAQVLSPENPEPCSSSLKCVCHLPHPIAVRMGLKAQTVPGHGDTSANLVVTVLPIIPARAMQKLHSPSMAEPVAVS